MAADLKARVATRAQTENGAVEQSPSTIAQFLVRMAPEMARAVPKHLNPDRLARIVLTEVRRTPLLAQCTIESFGGAVMTCAQLGLEPGATGEAYLLPFRNSKTGNYEVQLVVGYQGMAKLFWQSPIAKSLDAQVVYSNDYFEYEYGLTPKLIHRPVLNDRGDPIAYYAVATTTTGGSAFVVLSRADVEKIRKRSKAKDAGPWQTDYDAMARKTAVRQLFKLLPKSPELARAAAHDETVRTDHSTDALDATPAYIEAEVVNTRTGEITPPAEDEPTVEEARAAVVAQAQEPPADDDPMHYSEDEFAGQDAP